MDKIDYYTISEKKKLSYRCPILDICERRLLSIYFLSYSSLDTEGKYMDYLKKVGLISVADLEHLIEIRGEEPDFRDGETLKAFNNFCPEVNLFEDIHAFKYAKGTACASGEWDEFRGNKNKFKVFKYIHFSECAEFNYYYSLELAKKKKRRIAISKTLRIEILQRDHFKCKYCGRGVEDGVTLQVDHKLPVSAGGKTEMGNLITSCADCNNGKSDKIF